MSANRPVRLCSSKREVTRTSVRDGEAANGCTASSTRQAEVSKPIDCTISRPISRWAAIGKLPAKTSWRAGFIAICDAAGRARPAGARRAPRPGRWSCPARSGPAARRRGARPRGSTPRSAGRARCCAAGPARSARSRWPRAAVSQAAMPSEPARESSAVSSPGTRRATSWSRRTARTMSGSASAASSSAPSSGATSRSWCIRLIVASASPRAGAPSGGIITCWSHASRWPAWCRSVSSPSRSLSSTLSDGMLDRAERLDLDADRVAGVRYRGGSIDCRRRSACR